MPKRIAIITDSTCDLPPALAQDRQIYVTPLHILWGRDNLIDGIDMTPEAFYTRLAASDVLPTTSQPAPNEFAAVYERAIREQGASAILVLTVSKDLSGTYASAQMAASLVDVPVHVADSRNVSIALGLGALRLADARDAGASFEDLIALADSLAACSHIVFAVDTLEYMHKGGRIGGARRLLGTALNIKPILHITPATDGKVEARQSVRTRKRIFDALEGLLAEIIEPGKPLYVGVLHGGVPEDAARVRAIVEARYEPVILVTTQLSSVVSVHTGPGTIGFAVVQ